MTAMNRNDDLGGLSIPLCLWSRVWPRSKYEADLRLLAQVESLDLRSLEAVCKSVLSQEQVLRSQRVCV